LQKLDIKCDGAGAKKMTVAWLVSRRLRRNGNSTQ